MSKMMSSIRLCPSVVVWLGGGAIGLGRVVLQLALCMMLTSRLMSTVGGRRIPVCLAVQPMDVAMLLMWPSPPLTWVV